LFEADRLRALPEHERAELAELLAAADDRRKVVAGQHAGLARELGRPVREQDLRLADAAGIEEQLARCGVRGCVLGADADGELAEGDPAGLTAPAGVDQLALERQEPPEGRDRPRRGAFLESRLEPRATDLDLEHPRNPSAPSSNTRLLLARDHAAPESTPAL